jgi:hypothetical protein
MQVSGNDKSISPIISPSAKDVDVLSPLRAEPMMD